MKHLIKGKEKESFTSLEDEVEKLIQAYDAPENVTDVIKEFLIDSGNLYDILDLAKKFEQ